MLQIKKNEVEYDLLKDTYKKCQTTLTRERAHAILLSMEERNCTDISSILFRHVDTIRDWLNEYERTRISSIYLHYDNNLNASKLTKEQKEEIQETLRKPPSSKEGSLPKAFWDTSLLKEFLNATYRIVYESERSYHHLFEIFNFSFTLPDFFDKRRNDAFVLTRMEEIKKEVKELESKGYIPFTADECSLYYETESKKAWFEKGKKAILKVVRDKTRQSYFGALNLLTGKSELIKLSWQNTETIIEALTALSKKYPRKKLAIVWDNGMWHRSKELREMLGEGKKFSHIKFIWLPPYAPDHNPQEHVWKVGKQAVANTVTKTFIELQKIFEDSITGRKFDYKLK